MLQILLKNFNLFDKKYFKDYQLHNDFLTVSADIGISKDTLIDEFVEITKSINTSIFDYIFDNNVISITVKPMYKEITSSVRKELEEWSVVFPIDYNSLFLRLALEKDSELNFVDFTCSDLIEDRVTQHIRTLDSCANNALCAMQTRDELKLLEVIDETSKLRDKIRELKKGVYEDSLTKVYNRKWFDEHYQDEKSSMFTKNGTLVILDMNDFKWINDSYGHTVGDKVLVFIASRLKNLGGHAIRYGGDEFIILFDAEIDVKEIHQKFHILRQTLLVKDLKANNNIFKVSFSYGYAAFTIGKKTMNVLAQADNMMYTDKIEFKQRLSNTKKT